MKIQVGAGEQPVAGFVNVDIRPVPGVDVLGHAGDLRQFPDGSAEMIFGHAFFEHLFVGHHLPVLREWRRVLAPDGVLLILGIPDFATIARLYVERAPGIVGPRFDIYNVYRYTHGIPEIRAGTGWTEWDPAARPDEAPRGWLPQLHKALFDAAYLHGLMELARFDATVFAYAFPGESPPLNLGLAAMQVGRASSTSPHRTRQGVVDLVGGIPAVDRFITLDSIALRPRTAEAELMIEFVRRGDPGGG